MSEVATNTASVLIMKRFLVLSLMVLMFEIRSSSAFLMPAGAKTTGQQLLAQNGAKNDMPKEEYDAKVAKAAKAMTAFTNKYLANTGTKLCSDKAVPAVVIQGLAEHKVEFGAPLCPCRFYDDKAAEAKDGYWNCPCVPMRERHECHCMLFLTEDNTFAGEEVDISYDEVVDLTDVMSS
ncbi:thioredoxin reductase catalytic chain, chloroplastic [Seminavis robusta]|uniref:ferredoxin:thioredoxin reductase n=1 Tax=Seminavis robusta TaxID=568900 RepID=A0A9N8EB38_9STRA|nr:thioredoxin reductase catalytic chain, chloroplastic [Seminavis robusta]|eukprot:Sro753_g197420.1 thioredoxin reductase catalytic chain, chloroplastic (179) ;mRNA; r:35939-36767